MSKDIKMTLIEVFELPVGLGVLLTGIFEATVALTVTRDLLLTTDAALLCVGMTDVSGDVTLVQSQAHFVV